MARPVPPSFTTPQSPLERRRQEGQQQKDMGSPPASPTLSSGKVAGPTEGRRALLKHIMSPQKGKLKRFDSGEFFVEKETHHSLVPCGPDDEFELTPSVSDADSLDDLQDYGFALPPPAFGVPRDHSEDRNCSDPPPNSSQAAAPSHSVPEAAVPPSTSTLQPSTSGESSRAFVARTLIHSSGKKLRRFDSADYFSKAQREGGRA